MVQRTEGIKALFYLFSIVLSWSYKFMGILFTLPIDMPSNEFVDGDAASVDADELPRVRAPPQQVPCFFHVLQALQRYGKPAPPSDDSRALYFSEN